ncbi:MAG: penicillin-binding transpeptidase domain-containing protein [Christensenellales bacterium]
MKIEKRISRRFLFFGVVMLLSFALLIGRLYMLQISRADEYQVSSDDDRTRTIRLTGQRGTITDADSVVLAHSQDIYNVTFYRTRQQNSKANYRAFTSSILDTIGIVEKYGGKLSLKFIIEKDPETGEWIFNFGKGVSQKALDIREAQWRGNHSFTNLEKFPTADSCYESLLTTYQLEAQGLDEETILKVMAVYSEMQMNIFNSLPVVIAKDVPFSAVSEIIGRSMVLAGMDIEVGEKRIYPRANMASQVIGYVGPISDFANYNAELKPLGYALNDTIGKDGIEKSMENWLTANISSRVGSRVMERDNAGRLMRQLSYQPPTNGNNVKLTLLSSYQQVAERALAKNIANSRAEQEKKMFNDTWRETNRLKLEERDFGKYPLKLAETGAMMVVDVNTGMIRAMANYPTYDLNAMVAGGAPAIEILKDPRNILNNYCTQSRAAPGSIFKMVPAMAALTNGVLGTTETISDGGYFKRYTNNEKDAPRCWIPLNQVYKHANLNIVGGIKNSCNYFFYEISSRLYGSTGSNLLYKYAAQMGLTTKTGVQLPGEARSIVGNQTSLYDATVSISEQETPTPMLVAASIKKHLRNVGSSYGISYDEVRLDTCIKQLMDMAINTAQADWSNAMRPILMAELNMTRDMVWAQATVGDIWIYLNDIKWGGGLEVQMGVGQSITLLTPAAVARYVASLAKGTVYNLSIIDSITSPDGDILNQYKPSVFGTLEDAYLYLPYIKEGMKGVVDDTVGTANKYFRNWKYKDNIWAKTGTSQITVGGIKLDLENNGWFVALTPFEGDAEIAVVVHIPNGLSGALTSVAARDFIEWYLDSNTKVTDVLPVVAGNELMP